VNYHAGEAMRTLAVSLVLFGLALTSRPAAAQWGLTAEIGVARFGGTSRDTSGARVAPYRPTTFALRLDRSLGSTRVALAALYAKTGFAGERDNVAIVQYDAGSFWELAPDASFRLAHFGAGAEARLEAGPVIELWKVDGDTRTRMGGRIAAALEWPIARELTGSLRVSEVLTGSVFDAEEVPPGVELLATRRLAVAIGFRYGL